MWQANFWSFTLKNCFEKEPSCIVRVYFQFGLRSTSSESYPSMCCVTYINIARINVLKDDYDGSEWYCHIGRNAL
jgi:hypothetical protein